MTVIPIHRRADQGPIDYKTSYLAVAYNVYFVVFMRLQYPEKYNYACIQL